MKVQNFLLVVFLAIILGSANLFAAQPVKALWVWVDAVSNDADRLALVQQSAAKGVTDLYVSVYQETDSHMYPWKQIADLIGKAHHSKLNVWAAYGDSGWPAAGCSPTAWPLLRMGDVKAYDAGNPGNQFDGVVLDVEPTEPPDFQALLTLYQCIRSTLPNTGPVRLKLAVAIRYFWDTPISFGGTFKPAYQQIIDLDLDNVIVMGYRNFAGTADCNQGDGLICLDQDEIAYADSTHRKDLILAGLETQSDLPIGLTFFAAGQASMDAQAQIVASHFRKSNSFGGFAIHAYKTSYEEGSPGFWP